MSFWFFCENIDCKMLTLSDNFTLLSCSSMSTATLWIYCYRIYSFVIKYSVTYQHFSYLLPHPSLHCYRLLQLSLIDEFHVCVVWCRCWVGMDARWGRQLARTSTAASAAFHRRLPLASVRHRRQVAKRATRRVSCDWTTAATPEVQAGGDDRLVPP